MAKLLTATDDSNFFDFLLQQLFKRWPLLSINDRGIEGGKYISNTRQAHYYNDKLVYSNIINYLGDQPHSLARVVE